MPEIKNQYYYDKYNKFINQCKNRKVPLAKGIYTEKHHILPEALYPEYADDKNNLVTLRAREHYLAHWMLAKIYGGTMWFAYNQMKRIFKTLENDRPKSALYELGRKYVAQIASDTNSGRVMSDYQKSVLSEVNSGTVNVRDMNGNCFRVPIDDPRFETGEIWNARIGYEHTAHTKQLMSENGIRGKILCNNGTNTLYVLSVNDIPEGYSKGALDSFCDAATEKFKDAKHYHNPKTGEQVRSKEHPGGDFVEGRINGYSKGNDIMNNPDYLKLYNIKDFKSELVHKDEIQDYHIASSDCKMLIAGGYLFESLGLHLDLVPEVPVRNEKVSNPAGRQSPERREFCRNNKGKLISSFPIDIIKATEWKGDYTQYIVLTKFNYSRFNALQYKQDIFGIIPKGTNDAPSSDQ